MPTFEYFIWKTVVPTPIRKSNSHLENNNFFWCQLISLWSVETCVIWDLSWNGETYESQLYKNVNTPRSLQNFWWKRHFIHTWNHRQTYFFRSLKRTSVIDKCNKLRLLIHSVVCLWFQHYSNFWWKFSLGHFPLCSRGCYSWSVVFFVISYFFQTQIARPKTINVFFFSFHDFRPNFSTSTEMHITHSLTLRKEIIQFPKWENFAWSMSCGELIFKSYVTNGELLLEIGFRIPINLQINYSHGYDSDFINLKIYDFYVHLQFYT